MKKVSWLIKATLITLCFLSPLILASGCAGNESLEGQASAYRVQASKLFNEFSENETASNEKYVGKVLEVMGTIKGVNINPEGEINLSFEVNDMGAVSCSFSKDDSPQIASLKAGEVINVKGLCLGFLLDVVLENCVIINPKDV